MKLFFLICLLIILSTISGCAGFLKLAPTQDKIVSDTDSETVALVLEKEQNNYRIYCTAVWISDTEILTANHCVEAVSDFYELPTNIVPVYYSTKLEVGNWLENPNTIHMSRVVATDPLHDLALLESCGKRFDHKSAKIASSRVSVGDHLYFVGHPIGLPWTHIEGTVAAWREDMPVEFFGPFLQVSANVWFGNSGGGAFNDNGELVGIASFIVRAPAVGFYIPAESINKFLNENLSK